MFRNPHLRAPKSKWKLCNREQSRAEQRKRRYSRLSTKLGLRSHFHERELGSVGCSLLQVCESQIELAKVRSSLTVALLLSTYLGLSTSISRGNGPSLRQQLFNAHFLAPPLSEALVHLYSSRRFRMQVSNDCSHDTRASSAKAR